MCGQVLAAASGIVTALRMLGPWATLRFVARAARLLLFARRHRAARGVNAYKA